MRSVGRHASTVAHRDDYLIHLSASAQLISATPHNRIHARLQRQEHGGGSQRRLMSRITNSRLVLFETAWRLCASALFAKRPRNRPIASRCPLSRRHSPSTARTSATVASSPASSLPYLAGVPAACTCWPAVGRPVHVLRCAAARRRSQASRCLLIFRRRATGSQL